MVALPHWYANESSSDARSRAPAAAEHYGSVNVIQTTARNPLVPPKPALKDTRGVIPKPGSAINDPRSDQQQLNKPPSEDIGRYRFGPRKRSQFEPQMSAQSCMDLTKMNEIRECPPITTMPELPCIKQPLRPLIIPLLGEKRGIESNAHSSYLATTIFSMFAYSGTFDELLEKEVTGSLAELQRILRDSIVHVLRDFNGFVTCKYFVSSM